MREVQVFPCSCLTSSKYNCHHKHEFTHNLNKIRIYTKIFVVEEDLQFSSFAFLSGDASSKIISHHSLSMLPHFSNVFHSQASASCCFIVCTTCCVMKGQSSGKKRNLTWK